jgi:hypothetical protein
MSRKVLFLLLPLAALGCVDIDIHRRETASHTATLPSAAVAAAPITPDQVSAANARSMAHSLWEEMDRDELPPSTVTDKKHN